MYNNYYYEIKVALVSDHFEEKVYKVVVKIRLPGCDH